MSGTSCSGLSINNYLSKSERKHLAYCNGKSLDDCVGAEGCIWKAGKCDLSINDSLGAAYINGGFGFGKLCLDHEFTRLILMFLFPPAYIYLKESQTGFKKKREIILSFIYTSLFYIPGLMHALQYKHGG
jgi:uncharacterized membrane protein YqaE (UPF0057 family)